jgi:hypothetical protein
MNCKSTLSDRRHLFLTGELDVPRPLKQAGLLWNFVALLAYVTALDALLLNGFQNAKRWSFAWQCELKRG